MHRTFEMAQNELAVRQLASQSQQIGVGIWDRELCSSGVAAAVSSESADGVVLWWRIVCGLSSSAALLTPSCSTVLAGIAWKVIL